MKWKTMEWEILTPKEMSTSHIKNCIKQLQKRITDPYNVVWDKYSGSFTESCILEENKRIEKIIKEFEEELLSRNL